MYSPASCLHREAAYRIEKVLSLLGAQIFYFCVWTLNTKLISSNIYPPVNFQNEKPLLADEESTISKGRQGICQAQVQVQTPFPNAPEDM